MNNMYRPTPFFISRVVMTALIFFLYPFMVTMTVIWWLGLPLLSVGFFVSWWLTMTLVAFVGSALGLSLGALFPNPFTAVNMNTVIIIFFTFGAGFYANTSSTANFLVRIISWVSPLKYGCEMLFRQLLIGKPTQYTDQVLA